MRGRPPPLLELQNRLSSDWFRGRENSTQYPAHRPRGRDRLVRRERELFPDG